MDSNLRHLFDLHARAENEIADIYSVLSVQFAEEHEFWADLSREEKSHALWVGELAAAVERGTATFDEGEVVPGTLVTFIDYLERLHELFDSGIVTHSAAIKLMMDVERSLVEKQAFAYFKGDNEMRNEFLDKLNQATCRHAKMLENMLHKYSC